MDAIPYVNLAKQHAAIKAEVLAAVGEVLDRGRFILGDEVAAFERRFADLCGTRCAVAVNSGTDALILALRALGIGPGHEVITAPNSFVATASAIALAGARPVFADVGDDYNLDPERIEEAITSRTRVVLPVHLTGRPADMTAILQVAARRGLDVVEDCAQAVLAEHRGRRVGSFGRVGCFSLHPLKTLSACGDGGVLTTDDEALAGRLRVLRNLGLPARDDCVEWSGNSRLDSLQAAILLVKLQHLERWTERRRENAAAYRRELGGVDGVRVPGERPHERAVYHTFVIRARRRDDLKRRLAEEGIETAVHYPVPIHLQTAARGLGYGPGSFPAAERQAREILSLPVYPELEPAELERAARSIRRFYGG
ncbi:MAG: DegT/DnrJ/EryC1/StrS family aminotransferase [Planctomycetes bacterium]|nr:DegT/DnrJ/EryC1/StrS family aminotransferase [Planctomycetota bacterium]